MTPNLERVPSNLDGCKFVPRKPEGSGDLLVGLLTDKAKMISRVGPRGRPAVRSCGVAEKLDAERFAAEEAARVAEVADAITLGSGEA